VSVVDTRKQPPNADWLNDVHPDVPLYSQSVPQDYFDSNITWVVSPGIALSEPLVAEGQASGAVVIGDLDLFMQAAEAPVIGITGSNGKSTVTTLVGEMLSNAGLRAGVGGNLSPAALTLLNDDVDVYVLEMSSFQLERAGNLGLDVAVVLNVTADHIDHHGSMAAYHAAKHRIFRKAKTVVVNDDDVLTQPLVDSSVQVVRYGSKTHRDAEFKLLNDALWMGGSKICDVGEIALSGSHNHLNALVACAVAARFKVSIEIMADTLKTFSGLPHRCRLVQTIDGVIYINDSKATNVGAALAAIEGIGPKSALVLLAGGLGKGQDFGALAPAINRYARAMIVFGEAAGALAELPLSKPVVRAENMQQAVMRAAELAQSGDTILLSPACASMDQFKNYQDRGDQFENLVLALAGGAHE
jgi:UDP-N-acetylmuramoylalanine--D-glutamate ligase